MLQKLAVRSGRIAPGAHHPGAEVTWLARLTSPSLDSLDYASGQAIAKGLRKEQTTAGWRLRSVHLGDIG